MKTHENKPSSVCRSCSGAEVWSSDRWFNTTLHAAAQSGLTEVARLITASAAETSGQAQADIVNVKGCGGVTALMLACRSEHSHSLTSAKET